MFPTVSLIFQNSSKSEKFEDKYYKLEIVRGNVNEGGGQSFKNVPLNVLLKVIVFLCICDLNVVLAVSTENCVFSSLSQNDFPLVSFPFAS